MILTRLPRSEKLTPVWEDGFDGHYEIPFPDPNSSNPVMITNPMETRRLLKYCDLSWNDACLSFHKTSRAVATASAVQVRKPIYKSSVQLWKRYEKQLQPLSDILLG